MQFWVQGLDLAALRYAAAEAITMPGTWLMLWYIMPRFTKHMFEGGFLSYPQANTQPHFPNATLPVPSVVRRDCRALSIMWITWGFPDGNQLQPLHTDLIPGSTTHHMQPTPAQCPEAPARTEFPVSATGFKLHPRCTEFPEPGLLGWPVDAQQMFSAHPATPGPPASGLPCQQHCTDGWILTAPAARRMEGNPGNLGTKAAPSREKLRQCPAVTTGTAQGKMSKSKPLLWEWCKAWLPRYFSLSLSKHFFLCSETDVISKTWAFLFVFLNTDGNKCTTLKMPAGTHQNLHTLNINVSLDKFNLQSSSSEGKFWWFYFSPPATHIFWGKFPMFSKL